MKRWIRSIIIDSAVIILIILGGIYEYSWAMRLAKFCIWFVTIISFLGIFISFEKFKEYKNLKLSGAYKIYHYATEIIVIGLLVAIGWIWIAIFRTIAVLLFEAKRKDTLERLEKSNG